MSAIVCGKRSFFEELSASPASPVAKKHRCSSSSPVRLSPLDHLRSVFPDLDKQLLEKALVVSRDDVDSAIKSLNEMCLGYVDANAGSIALSNAATSKTYVTLENSSEHANNPRSGAEWVELFVNEMMNATSVDDARSRAMRLLESL
ncbi:uncharacterized protein [Rutidosis leptorrhynchoides]|uniref:uncharacterized protein n=1 Tax=Rutidosis leptorrhynchoides TaxID=125765 RepID=UPI003A994DC6